MDNQDKNNNNNNNIEIDHRPHPHHPHHPHHHHHDHHKEIKLDIMSDEQADVYNKIKEGNNVIVDACAGSGKSTTILSIANNMSDHQFIQLTYNSMLSSEIKNKVEKLGLQNLKVHTFHSLVVKYYCSEGYTDTIIRKILLKNIPPKKQIPKFHVLVIDEAQDMTFLYFKLLVKFCRNMGEKIQLLILGDYMQGLYEFKGADIRFLTFADNIWKKFDMLHSPHFHKCTLKMSYRITNQMADFINNVMLGEKRLYACKDGPKVVYLRRSTKNAEKYVIHKINQLLSQGASPSDFFILGGSVKGETSPIRRMENALVQNNIPCHVPLMENDKIDECVINGKVVFSTFHSVKGRQRKYVFVMGFDDSYFKYFARNISPNICPNTLYVASTRATHGLFLIEKDEEKQFNRPLKFLKMNHIQMKTEPYIEFHGIPQIIFYNKNGEIDNNNNNIRILNGRKLPIHNTTPTDLIKFIPESIFEEITPILDTIFISPDNSNKINKKEIDIPNLFKTKHGYYEDVSDLNGIAIPIMFFEKLNNSSNDGGRVLHNIILSNMANIKENEHEFLKKIISNLPTTCNTISDYLRLSNVYVAVKEKLYFKINQISFDEYTWLTEDIIQQCFQRMYHKLVFECFIDDSPNFDLETTIIRQTEDNLHKKIDDFLINYFPNELFRFTARIDLLTDYSVWELKCTNSITYDHLLQVVVYAWIWRMVLEDIENLENIRDFKIFNIKTGELLVMNATDEQLNSIMISLLKGKYYVNDTLNNDKFLDECNNVISI